MVVNVILWFLSFVKVYPHNHFVQHGEKKDKIELHFGLVNTLIMAHWSEEFSVILLN